MIEDSMPINACQRSRENVAGNGRCKENRKCTALSRCTPSSGVSITTPINRFFLSHPPPHLPFFPRVVLRPVAVCKQDVGAVLKYIQVLYTSAPLAAVCILPGTSASDKYRESSSCAELHSLKFFSWFSLVNLIF